MLKSYFDNMGVVRFVLTTILIFIAFIIFVRSTDISRSIDSSIINFILALLLACYFLICANSFFKRGFVASSVVIIVASSFVWFFIHYNLTWHGETIYLEERSMRLIFIPLSIYIGIYIMLISEIINTKKGNQSD